MTEMTVRERLTLARAAPVLKEAPITDAQRIANALERIASSLERMERGGSLAVTTRESKP